MRLRAPITASAAWRRDRMGGASTKGTELRCFYMATRTGSMLCVSSKVSSVMCSLRCKFSHLNVSPTTSMFCCNNVAMSWAPTSEIAFELKLSFCSFLLPGPKTSPSISSRGGRPFGAGSSTAFLSFLPPFFAFFVSSCGDHNHKNTVGAQMVRNVLPRSFSSPPSHLRVLSAP